MEVLSLANLPVEPWKHILSRSSCPTYIQYKDKPIRHDRTLFAKGLSAYALLREATTALAHNI